MNAAKADLTLYHNPRCSKSREALALLRSHGIEPIVIEYLNTSQIMEELTRIVALLGLGSEALVHKGEQVFKSRFRGKVLDEREWIVALGRHPILLERPIAVLGQRAVIGRLPERLLELLS